MNPKYMPKSVLYSQLGNRIREERLKLNLTQSELAEKVDLSDTYIGAIERGERSLTVASLIKVANVLGVSVDYLLSDLIDENDQNIIDQFRQIVNGKSQNHKRMAISVLRTIFAHLEND